jgi:hypothetical protein
MDTDSDDTSAEVGDPIERIGVQIDHTTTATGAPVHEFHLHTTVGTDVDYTTTPATSP